MKKNILPIALASTLLVAACSPDSITSAGKDDSEKTPIEFSMTDNTSAAVAVNGNTRAGFSEATDVVMQMVATGSSSSDTKTTKTTASAQAAGSAAYSTLSFSGDGSTRYWDDAYGRDTKLSIYAVAVPGKSTTDVSALSNLPGETTWSTTTTAHTLSWSVTQSSAQSADCIAKEDLVYSNNIQENGTPNGVYRWNFTSSPAGYPDFDGSDFTKLTNGQMQFALKDASVTDGPGKFDKGNLHFVHALSRVTIKVKYADGFSGSESVTEPTLIGQPYTGTFDVQKGSFNENPTTGNITMYNNTTQNEDGVKSLCVGQVLPGYVINKSSETTNFFSFKLADNTYYVSQAKVYEALATDDNKTKLGSAYSESDNKITMTQGQNYVLTVTVSKTKIDKITATLAEWTTIEGSSERNNAYLTFDFSTYSTVASTNFDLYRSSVTYTDAQTGTNYTKNYEWNKGYKGNSAILTSPEGDSKILKTNWYFEDNKTFYHFRTVGQEYKDSKYTAREIKAEESNASSHASEEYFDIASAATDGNYHWGAPMAKEKTLSYDKTSKGFDGTETGEGTHNISEAIGATESEIKLTEVNTLAKIVVNLKTSEDDSKVTFKNGDDSKTSIELYNIYTAGKVYMGNGLVVPTGNRIASTSPVKMNVPDDGATGFTYYVVPQALKEGNSGSETYVTFKITTPDGNVYYVKEKLSEIKPTSVKQGGTNVSIGQTTNDAIAYWYPNCTYTYTFTVKKTGIDKFTATLVPYTEIEGTNADITLED